MARLSAPAIRSAPPSGVKRLGLRVSATGRGAPVERGAFCAEACYDYADGTGGIAIVDAASAEALLEAVAPWATFFDFNAKPIVSVEVSTPIIEKSIAWRDSLK
jgi:hypothetical protein